MGCHGHGHWGHGCWSGECWGPGPGYWYAPHAGWAAGPGPWWAAEPPLAEPVGRGPYARRAGYRRYAGPVSPSTAAAQLEAYLASLRDEVRAVEADLAALRGADEGTTRPDAEV
jgi:hypothetical protein